MGYKKERIKEEETIDIWRIDYGNYIFIYNIICL